jgi:hypothetical protein
MRAIAFVLPATFMMIGSLRGQILTEHAAAVAGATIGTGAGKSLSDSMTKIFGSTDQQTAKAAKSETKKQSKRVTDPTLDPMAPRSSRAPISSVGAGPNPLPPSASHASAQTHHAARQPVADAETATAAVPAAEITPITPLAPEVKVPTQEEFAKIKVGTTEGDLMTALGQPSSRVIIPDDDGHLRETCQYWANGQLLGTIRLDNGQVASVESNP